MLVSTAGEMSRDIRRFFSKMRESGPIALRMLRYRTNFT